MKKTMMSELPKLEQAIESKQFVAHANSILDTEMATDKVNCEEGTLIISNVCSFLCCSSDGEYGSKRS